MDLGSIVSIASYVLVIIIIIYLIFIYISFLFQDKISKWISSKIKETRKEVIKIELQHYSLFIQLNIGLAIALILFSLSREGLSIILWGFFGLLMLVVGFFLLYWKYLPLMKKMDSLYNKNKS